MKGCDLGIKQWLSTETLIFVFYAAGHEILLTNYCLITHDLLKRVNLEIAESNTYTNRCTQINNSSEYYISTLYYIATFLTIISLTMYSLNSFNPVYTHLILLNTQFVLPCTHSIESIWMLHSLNTFNPVLTHPVFG